MVRVSDLPQLKKLYNNAMLDNKESFMFKDDHGVEHEMLVKYAKYLIEYLEQFGEAA